MNRAHTLYVVFAASVAATVSLGAQSAAGHAAQVAIVGNDYAFIQPPSSLPPGETLFAFENRGSVRHELSIALLKPGVALQDVLDLFVNGGRRRDVYETSIGVLLAFPKDTAGGRLFAKLIAGRSYVIVCSLRDKPDAQPHAMLGMIGGFTVSQTR